MKTTVFSDKVLDFYNSLQPDFLLPKGFTVMNPFEDKKTMTVTKIFYNKYFSDKEKRVYVFGINPGRFGGGLTGIPFTDPVQLKEVCLIDHDLALKKELSSLFIYRMITAFGGPEKFYSDFFLTAVCPLGFLNEQVNANYYDTMPLLKASLPFITDTLKQQLQFGCHTQTCICLGQGKNFLHLQELNKELGIFKKIIPLPHPRWIMQYRRKSVDEFIEQYLTVFANVER